MHEIHPPEAGKNSSDTNPNDKNNFRAGTLSIHERVDLFQALFP
jgi:hypothetical protein